MYEKSCSSQHEIPIKDSIRLIHEGIMHGMFQKRAVFSQIEEFTKLSMFVTEKNNLTYSGKMYDNFLASREKMRKGYFLFKRQSVTIPGTHLVYLTGIS